MVFVEVPHFFIKNEGKWLDEKWVSLSLGGGRVKKDLWKGNTGREITEEGKKRVRRCIQRNWEKRKRQKEQMTRENLEGSAEVQQQATEEDLSQRHAWDRTRQKERRNVGGRRYQISWQPSKDLPTVLVAAYENSNCQSPEMTISPFSDPSNTEKDTTL